jgi:hypothetical protein
MGLELGVIAAAFLRDGHLNMSYKLYFLGLFF